MKKYSELTAEEFGKTPILKLAEMEVAEFPERSTMLSSLYADLIFRYLHEGERRYDNEHVQSNLC